jgi:hypothetical protein
VTALSTTEAETIAAVEVTKEVIYLREYLAELGLGKEKEQPSPIMEDNAAVTAFVNELKNRAASRHYVARVRFLQDQVNDGVVKFVQTRSENQLADVLTKPIERVRFVSLREQIFGAAPIQQLVKLKGASVIVHE